MMIPLTLTLTLTLILAESKRVRYGGAAPRVNPANTRQFLAARRRLMHPAYCA